MISFVIMRNLSYTKKESKTTPSLDVICFNTGNYFNKKVEGCVTDKTMKL